MKQLTITIIFLFLLVTPIVSSYGTLLTPRIGLQLNLTNQDTINTTIRMFNPTNETLNVTLITQEFKDIETNRTGDVNIVLSQDFYLLEPNQTQESKVILTISQQGKYEGKIAVVFEKPNSKQKATLNSVIQINAFEEEKPTTRYKIILISAVILLLIILILIIMNQFKKGKIEDENQK